MFCVRFQLCACHMCVDNGFETIVSPVLAVIFVLTLNQVRQKVIPSECAFFCFHS